MIFTVYRLGVVVCRSMILLCLIGLFFCYAVWLDLVPFVTPIKLSFVFCADLCLLFMPTTFLFDTLRLGCCSTRFSTLPFGMDVVFLFPLFCSCPFVFYTFYLFHICSRFPGILFIPLLLTYLCCCYLFLLVVLVFVSICMYIDR